MKKRSVHSTALRRVLLTAAVGAALTACIRPPAPPVDDAPPPGSVWSSKVGVTPGGVVLAQQTRAQAESKSSGCMTCHEGIEPMHEQSTVQLGCIDCHGGNASTTNKYAAHVSPPDWDDRDRSTVPESESAEWLQHTAEYVRFVNPGDLRVADETCGPCHPNETYATKKSMMAHGGFLYGAVLYNNGSFPLKRPHFGEAYNREGKPVRIQTVPPPTDYEVKHKGVLQYLDPIPRYNVSQMGNILRTFERGGSRPLELANPERLEESGLPLRRLSHRGLGTLLRTDPVFLGIMKTRLLDPLLWMPGTNDNPGDYRHSGCTACHVIYANDRDPLHSGEWAQYGNRGHGYSGDKAMPKGEPGHPIKHQMTRSIPNSQCMVCHVHPGTNMLMTYYGDLWYDNETDAAVLYRGDEADDLSHAEVHEIQERNVEGAAKRGKWSDPEFLADISLKNDQFDNVQFEDYHGHGWLYRKVWKTDRVGNLLDAKGNKVAFDDPEKWEKTVHMKDIHLDRGMHCVDCHFTQDNHGTGKLHSEPRAATEILCQDCHGSEKGIATLITSGPPGGNDLYESETPFGKRFFKRGGIIYQRSQLDRDVIWAVPQVPDSIDPANKGKTYPEGSSEAGRAIYNEKARYAKTIQKDNQTWGSVPDDHGKLAHNVDRMTCQACHTSWTTACFGCHLPMEANNRKNIRHYEGGVSRNWTNYNYQVLRSAAYMLGIDGTVTGNKVSPVRSACAIVVGSSNQNREWLYSQQQAISAEGYSNIAFSTYVPHTVRTTETKTCTDCHISEANDNNAWMAQVLLHGTNYTNFMTQYVWVAAGESGHYAIRVTDRDEPQAVYGSTLHRDAYPGRFKEFVEKHDRTLKESYHHGGTYAQSLQHRGEYLYVAEGSGGTWIYDVSNIDNKGFSERITTSIFSPLGQRFYVKSKNAVALASPTTLAVDPTRPRNPMNEEQPIHIQFAFLYVADKEEGLIMILAATLLDGNPANNFLDKTIALNPDGLLTGARAVTVAGNWVYVACDAGLVILDLNEQTLANPVPTVAAVLGPETGLNNVKSINIQFRYAFVVDDDGMKVIDVTNPRKAAVVKRAHIPLADARDVYLARTYAFVSAGADGMAIVDILNPEKPKIDQWFTADGAINDLNQVKIAMTNASLFAYLADGKNGMRIVQLTAPERVPGFQGFSPKLKPELIATYHTPTPALAISKPVDRDRAVDESGNQLGVFGRIGSRPFNEEEMHRMYLKDGKVYSVSDTPKRSPR